MNTTKKEVTNIYTKLFWTILLTAFLVRVIGLASVPVGINQDEAMGAVDAWALSKYGTDRFGTFLPVHFTAWEYSQMSVLLAYSMIPFIKLMGFNIWAIRLPMVLVSTMGVALMYLVSKKFFSQRWAIIIMALTAVNPWQFMQSRWSLDCNLFPHVFLLGFYLLLLGLEKRKYLYLSMVFFGLTFYCYGIAVYTVPVFLFVYAAWCLWKKQLPFKAILISVVIFFAVAMPEIITMAINVFGWSTIETPLFTMPSFPESVRGDDILFMNFSFWQLKQNVIALVKQVFLQLPDHLFNTLPAFGPLYHISIPFIIIGTVRFTGRLFVEKDIKKQTIDLALWGFLITGIWAGVITREVNVNRINIIFYPLIMLCGYGIWTVLEWLKKWLKAVGVAVFVAYSVFALAFFGSYFTSFAADIQVYFNVDFLELAKEADTIEEYDTLYVTGNMGWQHNEKMSEILTQYACQIDALYYQEKSNETGGRTLLPYSQRYHFVNMKYHDFADKEGLYILHQSELNCIPGSYEVVLENTSFVAVVLR